MLLKIFSVLSQAYFCGGDFKLFQRLASVPYLTETRLIKNGFIECFRYSDKNSKRAKFGKLRKIYIRNVCTGGQTYFKQNAL